MQRAALDRGCAKIIILSLKILYILSALNVRQVPHGLLLRVPFLDGLALYANEPEQLVLGQPGFASADAAGHEGLQRAVILRREIHSFTHPHPHLLNKLCTTIGINEFLASGMALRARLAVVNARPPFFARLMIRVYLVPTIATGA